MLCYLMEHTSTKYVQVIRGDEKTISCFQKKTFEKGSKRFPSDKILPRLKLTTHLRRMFQISKQC